MKQRLLSILLSVLLVSVVLVLVPFGPAAQAATWTQLASDGITNATNLNLIPGAVFKGNLAVGSVPLPDSPTPGPASMYMYNGVTFTQLGAKGFGNPDCRGLIPTAVYRGELWIGAYDDTNGGELFHWSGSGNPVLVPQSVNG